MEQDRDLNIKVLVVDDDEDDFLLIKEYLAEAIVVKYRVDWAKNYTQALEAIKLNNHDVYLFDYNLGEKTGLELLTETKKMGSTVPIILLTGQGDHKIDTEAIKIGASDYLNKIEVGPTILERSIRYAIERKKAAELLKSVVDGSTQYAMMATDLDNNIILWNKGAEIIYGYTSDEVIGKITIMKLHSQDDNEADLLLFSQGPKQSTSNDYRMTALRKDGTTLPISVTVTPRIDDKGVINGHIIIVKDISKIRIQEQYREILIEIAHLVGSSPNIEAMCSAVSSAINKLLNVPVVFICLYDNETKCCNIHSQIGLCKDYKYHLCNFSNDDKEIPDEIKDCYSSFSDLIINSSSILNHSSAKYLDDKNLLKNDSSIIHIPLISDIESLGILHMVVETPKKDFLFKQSQILSLIANEISAGIQRKRLEEENKRHAATLEMRVKERTDQLVKKDAQLIQSGKLASLGEMATGIAHEINQPLGGINLMAQGLLMAMQKGKLTDEMLTEKLKAITEQIERISKIINHLRTFARQSGELKQDIIITSPINDTFKLIGQQLYNRGIVVEFDYAADIKPILADHNKMEQVFLNIIGNSRDAFEEFELEVKRLAQLDDKPEWVSSWVKKIIIKVYSTDTHTIAEISDTAGGMSKEIIPKIFDPFFTTKEVGKGTGLGLAISYGIIDEHAGKLECETEEKKGTKFTIKIPVSK